MINQIHPVPSTFDVSDNTKRENFENFQHQSEPKEKQLIEIITVPKLNGQKNQKNVAITIDTKLIHEILSKVYSKVCITEISTPKCLAKLAKRKPDLVFSGVKYFEFDGDQIWLNDFLELNKICYIGSNHAALDREYDKGLAKSIVKKAGIVTADYAVIKTNSLSVHKTLNMAYPVFVKPIIGGDSIGIDDLSLVFNREQLDAKIKQIFNLLYCDVLVESYIMGREFSVGILEDEKSSVLTAMPIEIIAPKNNRGHRLLDFDVKRLDQEDVIEVKNKILHEKLSEVGKSAFAALGGRSFGRIDVKLCAKGLPHFIEANLMPGLSKGYFFRSCAINLGMTYDEMILLLCSNRLNSC
jgi:D-alanine-D-alanine ligase